MTDKNKHTDPLMNTGNEDENLKKEAPFLFGLKKEEPYQAPVGYFEKFQVEISDHIHMRKASRWMIFRKPVFWAPAMVILIVGGIFLFRSEETAVSDKPVAKEEIKKLNDVSFEELDAYVNDHLLAQANTDEIIEMVGEKNIPSLGIKVSAENEAENETPAIQHVDEAEMEEYIMENLDEMEVY